MAAVPKNFEFMACRPEEFCSSELRQGDILERTPELTERISQAHQYYADAESYGHFMVLTPTCDLVRRNGACNARYITIAAVRPLHILVDRQLKKYKKSLKAPSLFCLTTKRKQAEQFLMRLMHNTEPGYFFLPGELFTNQNGPEEKDRVVFLKLSIALKVDHYDACVKSKILQLADSFSAKAGSLAANLYGQVATAAIEEQVDVNHEEVILEFIRKNLDRNNIYWLTPQGYKQIESKVKSIRSAEKRDLSEEECHDLVKTLPNDQAILADRIKNILESNGIDSIKSEELKNIISSDTIVTQFLKKY